MACPAGTERCDLGISPTVYAVADQIDLGDPAEDLIVATIIFLVDGKLVLLRPRKVS